ncbi:MAG: hypothetical protein KDA84_04880, partial [Planctomycetaceae bacterium]|nr:hypothetical protein [Planctomycetaceae bacterium]
MRDSHGAKSVPTALVLKMPLPNTSSPNSPKFDSEQHLTRREALAVVGTAAAYSCSWKLFADASAQPRIPPSPQLGVSLAGAEFGTHHKNYCNAQPGQLGIDYIYPDKQTIDYFASAGFGLFRIPFCWERIQPRLGKALNPRELSPL